MQRSNRLLLATSGLLFTVAATAQYNPLTPSVAYMGMARAGMLHRIGQDALNRSASSAFTAPAPAVTASSTSSGLGALFSSKSPASNPAFAFKPSPEVSEQVRQRMIQAVAQADPSQRAAAEQTFDSRQTPLKAFNALLDNYGYSGNNLLDVYTGYVVIAWEIINGADASGNTAAIRAVHAQLEQTMLSNAAVAQLTPSEKQDTAEVLAYQAALGASAKNELVRRSDAAQLQQLRSIVEAAAKTLGFELRGMQLTARGLLAGG